MSFSCIKLISKAFTLFRRFGNVVNHAFLVLISMSNILLVLLFLEKPDRLVARFGQFLLFVNVLTNSNDDIKRIGRANLK